jgi:hypothetical protein
LELVFKVSEVLLGELLSAERACGVLLEPVLNALGVEVVLDVAGEGRYVALRRVLHEADSTRVSALESCVLAQLGLPHALDDVSLILLLLLVPLLLLLHRFYDTRETANAATTQTRTQDGGQDSHDCNHEVVDEVDVHH